VIIAGSRGITDYSIIEAAVIQSGFEITRVVSGTARGVDQLGEKYAQLHNFPVDKYPADWNTHGKRAGYLRNKQMADNADALIAIWDGVSKGTKHMIEIAAGKGLRVYCYNTSIQR